MTSDKGPSDTPVTPTRQSKRFRGADSALQTSGMNTSQDRAFQVGGFAKTSFKVYDDEAPSPRYSDRYPRVRHIQPLRLLKNPLAATCGMLQHQPAALSLSPATRLLPPANLNGASRRYDQDNIRIDPDAKWPPALPVTQRYFSVTSDNEPQFYDSMPPQMEFGGTIGPQYRGATLNPLNPLNRPFRPQSQMHILLTRSPRSSPKEHV